MKIVPFCFVFWIGMKYFDYSKRNETKLTTLLWNAKLAQILHAHFFLSKIVREKNPQRSVLLLNESYIYIYISIEPDKMRLMITTSRGNLFLNPSLFVWFFYPSKMSPNFPASNQQFYSIFFFPVEPSWLHWTDSDLLVSTVGPKLGFFCFHLFVSRFKLYIIFVYIK